MVHFFTGDFVPAQGEKETLYHLVKLLWYAIKQRRIRWVRVGQRGRMGVCKIGRYDQSK